MRIYIVHRNEGRCLHTVQHVCIFSIPFNIICRKKGSKANNSTDSTPTLRTTSHLHFINESETRLFNWYLQCCVVWPFVFMWLRAIFQWASELNEHKLSSIDSKTVAHIQKHFVQFTAITHGNLLQSCIVVCASDCNRFFEYLRNSEKLERYFQKLKFCEELNEIKIRIEIQIIWKILKKWPKC